MHRDVLRDNVRMMTCWIMQLGQVLAIGLIGLTGM